MAAGQLNKVVEHLRRVLVKQDAGDLTDGDLVRRYIQQRDEAAFEALVRRHGPMVMGVCRRVLNNLHDAEDAFQATFLILVRKAASLRSPGMVGNWLYGVAYRTALEARKAGAKRRAKEGKVVPQTVTPEDARADLWPLLDEELERLPEKYRAVLVLCDLEGKTRKEAARQLSRPEGTVASRLASARIMLAKRLRQHGLPLAAGSLAGVLSQNAVSASVSASLVAATVKASTVFAVEKAATTGVISARVVALTERMLKGMLVTKIKTVLVVIVAGMATTLTGYAAMVMAGPRLEPAETRLEEAMALANQAAPALDEELDGECKEHQRHSAGGALIASPGAFPPLVKPDCSHCGIEALRRAGDLLDADPVLCWVRGDYDGGAIPLRFFLNAHRVISDKYGVFVYDPDAGFARGFAPSLEFRFHGWRNGIMVMRDKDGTLYSCLSGIAFEGPRKGSRLQPVPTLLSSWGSWLHHYPATLAYRMDQKYQAVELPKTVHKDSCHSRSRPDKRLPISTPILGVVESAHARAYPIDLLAQTRLIRETVDGQPRVLLWDQATRTAVAYRPAASPPRADSMPPRPLTIELSINGAAAPFFDLETGSRWDITGRAVEGELKGWTLTWLEATEIKWFAWAAEYPETSIYGR